MRKNTSPNPELDIVVKSSEIAHQNPYYRIRHDIVTINDIPGEYWTLQKPVESAFIIAVQNDKILLIYQHRYAPRRWGYEAPAGSLLPGEDIIVGAQRELREETGYVAAHGQILGKSYAVPGFGDIQHHTVLLTDLTLTHHEREKSERIASVLPT